MSIKSPLINVMILAARKVSRSIVRDFGEIEQLQASKKGSLIFAKNTITKVQKNLVNELVKSRPEWSIMVNNKLHKGKDSMFTWVIDPLDGFSNISHGMPFFSISIAVSENSNIISGIIYDPLRDEMFVSEKGSGSYLNDRRLRVSARRSIENSIFSTNIENSNENNNPLEKLAKLSKEKGLIRFLGTTSLDLAYVAAGRFDGLWLNYQDFCKIAAGSLIISEAGGIVNIKEIHFEGLNKNNIVACNTELSTKFLSIIDL